MELGGAEMALTGLLHALDPNKVDVDLFVYDHRGPLMQFIPESVNLLPEIQDYRFIERPMKEALKAGQLKVVVGRLLAKQRHKKYIKNNQILGDDASALNIVGETLSPLLPAINPQTEYDLCISFLTPHHFARDHVRAKKKIAWIHTDYTKIHIDRDSELPVWDSFDHVVSISPDVTKSFVSIFPTLKDKIIEIENIIPKDLILSRSKEFTVEKEMNAPFSILSIGRYCYPKNFDNVPFIAKRLKELGLKDFKWYIIGYGPDEALIRQKIKEAGMEETVILLGKKSNPYPYIKACDVYIQPSRYEGKSITVREAQILGKQVIITNYPTAHSQIKNGEDGYIVNMENNECAKDMYNIFRGDSKDKVLNFLGSFDYSFYTEQNKILQLLKG